MSFALSGDASEVSGPEESGPRPTRRTPGQVCVVSVNGVSETMDRLQIDVETDVLEDRPGRDAAPISVRLFTSPSFVSLSSSLQSIYILVMHYFVSYIIIHSAKYIKKNCSINSKTAYKNNFKCAGANPKPECNK